MRIHRDMYGNGTPGLLSRMDTFIITHETQEEEREKQHKENKDRLNFIIALLVAIAAYIAIWVSIHGLPKTSALPVSQTTNMATTTQDAQLPTMR